MKKALTPPEYISAAPIKAGFPNPADDAVPVGLDLNKLIVRHPISTFYLRIQGGAMVAEGIQSGDIVVVDKSLTPKNGDLVIAAVHGEFLVRYLKQEAGKTWFVGAQSPPMLLEDTTDVDVWGVVTYVMHKCRS